MFKVGFSRAWGQNGIDEMEPEDIISLHQDTHTKRKVFGYQPDMFLASRTMSSPELNKYGPVTEFFGIAQCGPGHNPNSPGHPVG